MTIDLTPRWKDFAVYLPALQFGYASDVVDNKRLKKDRVLFLNQVCKSKYICPWFNEAKLTFL